ncbi:hypothetical protein [Thiohalorhabdus sp.]|uniref:hypothetical protein n=1 Tax=Thiohalorhabdus sp. TaxID=3094134 RepID=UPI002FC338BB
MVRRKNNQLWPVQVTVETKEPVVVALMAYRNAHWKVRNKGKGPIKGVVLAGHGKQKVSGLSRQVPVQAYTYKDSPCGPCRESGNWFQAFRRGTEDYRKAVDRLKEITGLRPASFQGREEGKAFYVGGGSQAFGK